MQKENSATFCIAVKVVKCSKNPAVEIDNIRDMVIPFLLGTVVKGTSDLRVQIYSGWSPDLLLMLDYLPSILLILF